MLYMASPFFFLFSSSFNKSSSTCLYRLLLHFLVVGRMAAKGDVDSSYVFWGHTLLSVVSSCRSHIGKAWTEMIPRLMMIWDIR